MNKKIAVSAIALFAVTLGLGVLNPALASKPNENGEHKLDVCHFSDAEDIFNATGDDMWHNSTAGWTPINIDMKGWEKGHYKHNNGTHYDFIINDTDGNPATDLESCFPPVEVTIGP